MLIFFFFFKGHDVIYKGLQMNIITARDDSQFAVLWKPHPLVREKC